MTGASIVSGYNEYAANLGKKTIVGFVSLAQNNIGPDSTIPECNYGYDGSTVEIINTDAEGRLLMADCLSYATKHYMSSNLIDLNSNRTTRKIIW